MRRFRGKPTKRRKKAPFYIDLTLCVINTYIHPTVLITHMHAVVEPGITFPEISIEERYYFFSLRHTDRRHSLLFGTREVLFISCGERKKEKMTNANACVYEYTDIFNFLCCGSPNPPPFSSIETSAFARTAPFTLACTGSRRAATLSWRARASPGCRKGCPSKGWWGWMSRRGAPRVSTTSSSTRPVMANLFRYDVLYDCVVGGVCCCCWWF